jgi:hypothetical protein
MTDHLEPNDSPITVLPVVIAYFHAIGTTLLPKVDRKAKAVATIACLPSFECEWVLCLECSRSGHYTLYACTAEEPIWPLEEGKAITTKNCECEISPDLGCRLHELFRIALLGTRHSHAPRIGLDGVTYHFSYDEMSGKTWSPPDRSIPGKLCSLADNLYNGTVDGRVSERRIRRLAEWFRGNLPGFEC